MTADPRIRWALREMENRMGEPLQVSDLAATVKLSTSRFSHLFLSETGESPGRFLRNLRLDRARVLFENTTLSVREVMHLVGCTDRSHFARDYRDRHGLRPRESRIGRRKGAEIRNGWRTPNENRHGD
jgi:AraC family transcriptional regulator, arabinose operon regulatory protein